MCSDFACRNRGRANVRVYSIVQHATVWVCTERASEEAPWQASKQASQSCRAHAFARSLVPRKCKIKGRGAATLSRKLLDATRRVFQRRERLKKVAFFPSSPFVHLDFSETRTSAARPLGLGGELGTFDVSGRDSQLSERGHTADYWTLNFILVSGHPGSRVNSISPLPTRLGYVCAATIVLVFRFYPVAPLPAGMSSGSTIALPRIASLLERLVLLLATRRGRVPGILSAASDVPRPDTAERR